MDSGSYLKCECDVAAWMHMWMSHMWMIHGFGVICQMWMWCGSLNAHVNESRGSPNSHVNDSWIRGHISNVSATWQSESTCEWVMTHSRVRHDLCTCETWLIHVSDNDSFVCVTWLIHTWDLTHSCVWRGSVNSSDAFVLCDTDKMVMNMGHDSFVYVTWQP